MPLLFDYEVACAYTPILTSFWHACLSLDWTTAYPQPSSWLSSWFTDDPSLLLLSNRCWRSSKLADLTLRDLDTRSWPACDRSAFPRVIHSLLLLLSATSRLTPGYYPSRTTIRRTALFRSLLSLLLFPCPIAQHSAESSGVLHFPFVHSEPWHLTYIMASFIEMIPMWLSWLTSWECSSKLDVTPCANFIDCSIPSSACLGPEPGRVEISAACICWVEGTRAGTFDSGSGGLQTMFSGFLLLATRFGLHLLLCEVIISDRIDELPRDGMRQLLYDF